MWGERKGLTSHRVRAGHEVQRDGVGGVGRHALQVALRDFVEAVGWGGHVFIHPVQERVHAWFLGLPQFQVSPGALAVFASSLHVLWIAGQCGCNRTKQRRFSLIISPSPHPAPSAFTLIYCCSELIVRLQVFTIVAWKQCRHQFRHENFTSASVLSLLISC